MTFLYGLVLTISHAQGVPTLVALDDRVGVATVDQFQVVSEKHGVEHTVEMSGRVVSALQHDNEWYLLSVNDGVGWRIEQWVSSASRLRVVLRGRQGEPKPRLALHDGVPIAAWQPGCIQHLKASPCVVPACAAVLDSWSTSIAGHGPDGEAVWFTWRNWRSPVKMRSLDGTRMGTPFRRPISPLLADDADVRFFASAAAWTVASRDHLGQPSIDIARWSTERVSVRSIVGHGCLLDAVVGDTLDIAVLAEDGTLFHLLDAGGNDLELRVVSRVDPPSALDCGMGGGGHVLARITNGIVALHGASVRFLSMDGRQLGEWSLPNSGELVFPQ